MNHSGHLKWLAALLAQAALWPIAALADSESIARIDSEIDEIVVVAHKDERSVRDIAANVTSMSRAEINSQLATSINDVLRYQPGVDYEAGGTRFGTEGVSIRGVGGNRVAIIVDGVPLSDHFDVGSFANATRDFVDAGLIQNIEVLHGPASALYGSSAIGGVVAITTPDPFDIAGSRGFGGDVLATWQDANNGRQGPAMFGTGGESLGFFGGFSWRDESETKSAAAPDSADTRDAVRRTALLKVVGDNRFGHSWRGQYIRQEASTDSELKSLLGQGRYRSTTRLAGDDAYDFDAFIASYEFGGSEQLVDDGVVRIFIEQVEFAQQTLDERAAARTPVSIDRHFSFKQDIHGIELNLWKNLDSQYGEHRLGFGAEYRERRTEEFRDGLSTNLETGEQTANLLGEQFPLRDFPISVTRETGVFVEDMLSIGDWKIIGGLRVDYFDVSPTQDPMYLEDYPFAELVSIKESEVSPKLGLIFRVTPNTDVYAQYSHGYRAPPYADANIGLDIPFFNYRAIPNPDLRSESSDAIDLGLRWSGDRSSARVALFRTRYEDFIESKVRLGTDPVSGRTLFQSQNLRETRIEGIEGGADIAFSGQLDGFSLNTSAYYARGRNNDTGAALNSVGPPQATIGLAWRSRDDARHLQLMMRLVDDWSERDESTGELFKPAGHAVLDLLFAQQLSEATTLRAGLHNLTDRLYWNWSDVRGLAADDPLLPYLAQSGLSVSISLQSSW